MAIDVFLRWYPGNALREHFANAVRVRLFSLKGVQVHTAFSVVCCSQERYHIESKQFAENNAESEIYSVIDDDQLPIADDFFEVGAATLANHPEYGMLAGFPLEYAVHGQPYAEKFAFRKPLYEVVEAHSIGCPYFVRKGTLSFPDGPLRQYDGILSKVVTDQGLKTGFAMNCLYNHLGYGFSQIGHAD